MFKMKEELDQLQSVLGSEMEALRSDVHHIPSRKFVYALTGIAGGEMAGRIAQQLVTLFVQMIAQDVLSDLWSLPGSQNYEDESDFDSVLEKWTNIASVVDSHRRFIAKVSMLMSEMESLQRLEDRLLVVNMPRNFDWNLRLHGNKAPKHFKESLRWFLSRCLDDMFISGDSLCENDVQSSNKAVHNVSSAVISLRKIGVQSVLRKEARLSVESHIKNYLNDKTEESITEAVVYDAICRIEAVYLKFMQSILADSPSGSDDPDTELQEWYEGLMHFVYTYIGDLRTASLFDLVIDFPESLPALKDLRVCLKHTGRHRHLASTFGNAVRGRLLHPGAATGDIIQHYVSTIRALQHVDPSGAVLHAVSAPLREYLRSRKDAIRCIVTMLTESEDESGALASLMDIDENSSDHPGYDVNSDFWGSKADEQALHEILADQWEPGPLEVAPLDITHLEESPTGDVISMLVNIYGTKELFVSEYRAMLADRLLAKNDFECDRELRTLELLKVRFGESSLHTAEVMLKDFSDSKRINGNVRTVSNTSTPLKNCRNLVPIDNLSVLILSQLFWPQIQTEDFVLPAEIKVMLDTFAHKFHALKAPRVLQWKPNLGLVDLTLTIGEQSVDFLVSPLLATLLIHFKQQPVWSLEALAEKISLPKDVIKKKMVYWINQGVVAEKYSKPGELTYIRNEEICRPVGFTGDAVDGLADDLANTSDTPDAMSSFEPFVMGMLTNFDSLSLDRIHNMLKMFVTDPPYDKSIEDLSAFMAKLSTEDKIVLEGGLYKKRNR